MRRLHGRIDAAPPLLAALTSTGAAIPKPVVDLEPLAVDVIGTVPFDAALTAKTPTQRGLWAFLLVPSACKL